MSDETQDCVFCGIAERAELLAESESVVAVADINPVVPGHTLVIPRRHAETYIDLNAQEAADSQQVAAQVATQTRTADDTVGGFNMLWNCGAMAWQSIPHAHMHIVPRREDENLMSAIAALQAKL